MLFRIPARQVQQINIPRYGNILFRIEERDTPHFAQYLQMFLINERERFLITRHRSTQTARFPTADPILPLSPHFPQRKRRLFQQQFPIHVLFQQPCQSTDGIRTFGSAEIKPQITRFLLQRFRLRKVAQTGNAHLVTHFPKHFIMPGRPHAIEYHPRNPYLRTKMNESRQQRSHRISGRLGIHHQHDRKLQQPRYLRRRPPVAIVPVEHPHHPFHNAGVRRSGAARIKLAHMFTGSHKRVQINGRASAYSRMVLGIDIIRSAFKRLYRQPFLRQQSHQAAAYGSLSATRCRGCYEKLRNVAHVA